MIAEEGVVSGGAAPFLLPAKFHQEGLDKVIQIPVQNCLDIDCFMVGMQVLLPVFQLGTCFGIIHRNPVGRWRTHTPGSQIVSYDG